MFYSCKWCGCVNVAAFRFRKSTVSSLFVRKKNPKLNNVEQIYLLLNDKSIFVRQQKKMHRI